MQRLSAALLGGGRSAWLRAAREMLSRSWGCGWEKGRKSPLPGPGDAELDVAGAAGACPLQPTKPDSSGRENKSQ